MNGATSVSRGGPDRGGRDRSARRRRRQSRSASFAEATANVALGFLLALLVQSLLYPALGIITTLSTDLLIAAIFTLTSLVRGYVLRRAFEHLARP